MHLSAPIRILQRQAESVEYKRLCRHSSVVEQLIRNQQVLGSNPSAGSRFIKVVSDKLRKLVFRENVGRQDRRLNQAED